MTDDERTRKRHATEQAYRMKHREKRRLYSAQYNTTDKGKRSQKTFRAANKDTIRAKAKAYRLAHLDEASAREKAYQLKNRDAICARARAKRSEQRDIERAKDRTYYASKRDYLKNYRAQHHESIKATKRAWVVNNRGAMRAIRFKRIMAERQALPVWANLEAMKAIYQEAARLTQQTGIKHEVDHIIPIQSPLVCGLHCEANLQILTKAQNRAKSNAITPHISQLQSPSV